jgi:ribosome maturation protein Sdo1
MLASQKDLIEYFNTSDSKLVCQEILEKGELQVL